MDIAQLLSPLKTWKFWKELALMTIAMLLTAIGVYYILVPSKLIVGSISGLSIVISTLFENVGVEIKVSTVLLIINAILLILAYFLIGKEFGLKTVYTALILSPLMDLCARVLPNDQAFPDGSMMGDPWLDLVCFVLILSIAQALLFRINASTGGLDILAKIVNKYAHADIGTSVSIAGACICATALLINPFRLVILGLIGTYINGLMVDFFTASLNRRKRVCIISKEHERVRQYIIGDLGRGCSLYEVKGGFSGENSIEIQVLLTQSEFADLMKYLSDNDIHAFITAGNCSEVYGLWSEKKHRRRLEDPKSAT
ncbi:MAG: YitT family protein [Bacteroidales bacterium]|nr:YitT family protein [Bacteroidales bacterium]MBP5634771.1 YitT family protein [Bacteroidales bacterium]